MTPSQDDKAVERSRYDAIAQDLLARARDTATVAAGSGSASVPAIYRRPYLWWEQCVRGVIRPGQSVLELGSGTGAHTRALLDVGARVTATDISISSLEVLTHNVGRVEAGLLQTRVADIEALPFANASFDVVTCAGSLSYGDPALVDAGVLRVLKPGGAFICVDSLNHNPLYRLNRWMHFIRGERTRSTLLRMPTAARIASIAGHFSESTVRYFGAISWAMPVVARLVGETRAATMSDRWDDRFHTERSAFKFVLVAQGRR